MDVEEEGDLLNWIHDFGEEESDGNAGFRRCDDVLGAESGEQVVGRRNFVDGAVPLDETIFVDSEEAVVERYMGIVGLH